MNLQRVKAIGRLVLLFGVPISVVLGLFSCGAYVGAGHRHTVTYFEHEWLGLNVEVVPASGKDPSKGKSDEKADGTAAKAEKTAKRDPSGDDTKVAAREPAPVTPVKRPPTTEAPAPAPTAAEPAPTTPPTPVAALPTPAAPADPIVGSLARRLATPVTVQLKVLVDDELVAEEPAWVDYAQRTVSRASAVYKQQFGIELELASVGRWGVATAGMSADELARDLAQRPREAAQVLVGLTNRPFDVQTAGVALVPANGSPFNGAVAVVYATPGHREAHLRTLLHEVAHLFGAKDISDPASADYTGGSWMSYAAVPESQAAWIDPQNRERVLLRKDKPFKPQAAEPLAEEGDPQ